ncbi:restriction endonuclease subunit S [Neglectibacter timonensis]|uniref:restriction endonuclease subunit S n=1 Tax=Neglectibacter timonensis TaxID=1776382 RepID=UPI00266CB9C5|nr:restriction endonuclease subunit S [Neglectibacter timonensis]
MAKYRFDQIAINSTEKKKPVEEDRFTYLGLEHLDSGTLKVTRFGSEVAPIGEKLVMHKGDVLFGKRRAYQKKVAIAPFDGIFSAHGMVLRPKENVIDKDFFPLFISSDYFLDAAIKISVGSLSPTINWRDLKELEFELPDMDSQRKLAEVLWSINDTMEAYKKLISATDELVKSQFMEQFGDPKNNQKGLPVLSIGQFGKAKGGKRLPKGESYADCATNYPYNTAPTPAILQPGSKAVMSDEQGETPQ